MKLSGPSTAAQLSVDSVNCLNLPCEDFTVWRKLEHERMDMRPVFSEMTCRGRLAVKLWSVYSQIDDKALERGDSVIDS